MCTQKTQWLYVYIVYLFFELDTLMLVVSKVLRYIVCVKYCTMNNDQRFVEGVEASGTYFNVLIAMYVKGVKSGVWPLTFPREKATVFKKHSIL